MGQLILTHYISHFFSFRAKGEQDSDNTKRYNITKYINKEKVILWIPKNKKEFKLKKER